MLQQGFDIADILVRKTRHHCGDQPVNIPKPDSAFEEGGNGSRPKYGQLTVCWADDEATARKIAHEWWPTAALGGELSQELPMPAHFEQATQDVTEEQVAESVVCGNDASRHLEQIQAYIDAGFDHVYIHQVGPDQQGFFQFYEREILPEFR